jgi:hypothetical protein
MKFPSIQTLVQATLNTCRRFPLTILFILAGCYYGMRINHLSYVYNDANDHYDYTNKIWSAFLGMLLSLNWTIYSERKKLSPIIKWAGIIITIALIVAFYFSLPDHFSEARLKQFILFTIGLHLLVAFIPFTAKGEVNGFWQYNKTLFLRILAAALYSAVLFIGLALAMLAIDKLFSVDIKSKWYVDLWICLAGGFSSIFFLAGFPADYEKMESIRDYPKGLKIFTQYVLLPIITVYLVILYAYMFKIIGTRHLPYGWVGYLVLAFAIAGILSILLIHPIRLEANTRWILGFSRFFYLAICPLIALLFIAIGVRIHAYGITEERYFVLVLACWLALIAVYFIFSKEKNIKFIPFTLCLLAFLVSFGPWGAFSVSFRSQNNRLIEFLRVNKMLSENQKIIPATASLHKGDADQMRSIINYLVETHGYKSLQPIFSVNLDSITKDENGKRRRAYWGQSSSIISYMKIDKYDSDEKGAKENYFWIRVSEEPFMLTLTGYEYYINDYDIGDNSSEDSVTNDIKQGNIPLHLVFNRNKGRLTLQAGPWAPLIFDVKALVGSLRKNDFYGGPDNKKYSQDSLIIKVENQQISAKCILKEIFVHAEADSIQIRQLTADILLHFKKGESNKIK